MIIRFETKPKCGQSHGQSKKQINIENKKYVVLR